MAFSERSNGLEVKMNTPKWTIPEHCVFRVDEDGHGFMFDAETDALHPINPTGILVLRHLNGDVQSERDIFDRIWPLLEESVKQSVLDDISVFLKDLCEYGCLIDNQADSETGVAENEAVTA